MKKGIIFLAIIVALGVGCTSVKIKGTGKDGMSYEVSSQTTSHGARKLYSGVASSNGCLMTSEANARATKDLASGQKKLLESEAKINREYAKNPKKFATNMIPALTKKKQEQGKVVSAFRNDHPLPVEISQPGNSGLKLVESHKTIFLESEELAKKCLIFSPKGELIQEAVWIHETRTIDGIVTQANLRFYKK